MRSRYTGRRREVGVQAPFNSIASSLTKYWSYRMRLVIVINHLSRRIAAGLLKLLRRQLKSIRTATLGPCQLGSFRLKGSCVYSTLHSRAGLTCPLRLQSLFLDGLDPLARASQKQSLTSKYSQYGKTSAPWRLRSTTSSLKHPGSDFS